jgi:rod shape-determining protein MreC
MRNLLLLFSKYGALVLFILLEVISFFLIVNYNNKQKEIFLYSSNLFSGKILDKYDDGVDYFNLKTINDSILQENARILSNRFNYVPENYEYNSVEDTSLNKYELIPASICNMTLHLRNNRMTIDKGTNWGIKDGMGVIAEKGIVGVVRKVNSDFASIVPLINTQLQISAKIKNKNYFGDLKWEPYDERFVILKHIPKHAKVSKGDTVITSGYSTIFPGGIEIGKIIEIRLPEGDNYFEIVVDLNNRIGNLEHVYVINYKLKDLQLEMESDQ